MVMVVIACQVAIGNRGGQRSEVASSAAIAPGTVNAASVAPTSHAAVPHSVFKPILGKLKAKTQVPIRLPAYVPESRNANPLYALLEVSTSTKYRIMLAFAPDCNGGTACRLGMVSGEKIMPQVTPLKGKPVSLAQGITGYFVDAVCRANCSDATLTWEQDRSRFTVAIKAGKLETLIKMANSAITIRL
jgi:hypothetical protein